MRLGEFERALATACREAKKLPFNVVIKPYCSNGRDERGISFIVNDSKGNYYGTWYSGSFSDVDELEIAIKEVVKRMEKEC